METPKLPERLEGHDLEADELYLLWRELILEMMDPEFITRTHGKRRTYDAGCKGPMCGKEIREHGRRRLGTKQVSSRYIWVDQIIEHWKPIAQKLIDQRLRAIKKELTS